MSEGQRSKGRRGRVSKEGREGQKGWVREWKGERERERRGG